MDDYSKSKEDLFKELQSTSEGLSNEEVQKRLEKYGKNEIKRTHKLRPIKIFFSQFKSFLIYILIIATIISVLIQNYIDALVIAAIVIVNALIGFFQQYKAEKAIIGLRKLLVPISEVIRDGKHVKVSSSEIVPGDIVLLKAGDKINADCRVIELSNLQTDEAILTGESLPISKVDKTLSKDTILAERFNMLYTGTKVVSGSATGLVVSTGMYTEFGNIASELQRMEPQKTPMQKRLDLFSKQLGFVILGLVLIIALLGILDQFDKVEMFMTALALAVSAIPEGLPAVLAISFSISSMMMSRRNVIIRRLPAVESLGSVTVICSDKTGTLTEEKMNVQEIFSGGKTYDKKGKDLLLDNKKIDINKNKQLFQLIKTSVLCNNARYEKIESGSYSFMGDPTEESFLRLALDLNISKKKLTEEEPRIKEFEFDSKRKMMSLLRDLGRNQVLYSKGAPEKIIEKCASELVDGRIKTLTAKRKIQLLEESKKMEKKALRVLGFAYKNFTKKAKVEESGLIFLGFMGMIDPPRKEIKLAMAQTRAAGIKIKIITGDSALTAKAIANQIGIDGEVMEGHELDKLSESQLEQRIENIVIFARTTPEQKLKITSVLQKMGEVVAITGDGINDVLALKAADVGIAMGQRGTDVARDTADVVLIDDNFASIVSGIEEGRRTYDNIKKFTKYFLAVNFSAIFLVLVSLLMGLPLPLLPLQILWMNLITDSFPALTLVFEKGDNVMKSKPRNEKSLLDNIWKFIITAGIIAFIAEFAIYIIGIRMNLPIANVRSMVLTTAILFELLFVYTVRSSQPLTRIGIFSNKWLNYSILLSIILQFILIYTPLAEVFQLAPLTLSNWLLILPFAFSGVIIFEIAKYIKHRE